jgi:hypothetical protein
MQMLRMVIWFTSKLIVMHHNYTPILLCILNCIDDFVIIYCLYCSYDFANSWSCVSSLLDLPG